MKTKLIALVLSSLLPIAGVQAAEQAKSQRHTQHNSWHQELKLNAEQQRQFEQKNTAHRNKMQEQRSKWHAQQSKQKAEQLKKQQALRERHHNDLRKILTPEQRAVFDRKLEQRSAHKAYHQPAKMQGKHNYQGRHQGMHGKKHHKHEQRAPRQQHKN